MQLLLQNVKGLTFFVTHGIFQPVAIETLGPLNTSALNFLSEVGHWLTSLSGDSHETSFLFQRLSVLIQCFNCALITDSFCFSDVMFVFSF